MKTIYQIAKSELHSLFCSPIAWIILMLFTFQESMGFTEMVIGQLRNVFFGNPLRGLTSTIYISGFGQPLYSVAFSSLYLFLPLLTMGLMTREYNSGSIKLLFSSPITNTQIILGKYLSMLIYGLIFIAILSVYVIFGALTIKDMDIPLAVNGLFAIYLLICFYSAIGLFVSCLTTYQVVAAIGTFAVYTLINNIGGLFSDIPFVRDITFWLTMGTHGFIRGLITSEDVLYYILMSGMFISFSILKLHFDRNIFSWYKKVSRYLGIFIIVIGLGYITSRPQFILYWDITKNKENTLTPKSQEIIKQFDGELKLTSYVNTLDLHMAVKALPKMQNGDKRAFYQYVRFKPDIKFDYIYFYNHILGEGSCCEIDELVEDARKQAKSDKMNFSKILSPSQMYSIRDLTDEENRFTREFTYVDGSSAFVRMFNDLSVYPGEQEISVALKTMLDGTKKIGFLTGHAERSIEGRSDKDYYGFSNSLTSRGALINHGFNPQTIFFDRNDRLPDDLDILVISDARDEFDEEELNAIKNYIAKGGNCLISTDAYRAGTMGPILELFGVRQLPGILVQEHQDYSPTLLFNVVNPDASEVIPAFGGISHLPLLMQTAVPLDLYSDKGFNVTALTVSPLDSWVIPENDFSEDKITFNPELKENRYLPTSLILTREMNGKEQRAMIFGDADWMSRGVTGASRTFGTANLSVLHNGISWLVYNEYPLYLPRPDDTDTEINWTFENRESLKLLFNILFPLIWIVGGIVVWARRRRK